MMDLIVEILLAVGVAMQSINLFFAGYLLKRVDVLDMKLYERERVCRRHE